MASIVVRGEKKICVVTSYVDEAGKRRQKWETFQTMSEAKHRKTEIEYQQQLGEFQIPNCKTMGDLLKEYVHLYGKITWSPSAYTSNTGLINNYILPALGNMSILEVTPRVLERYYQDLLKTPAVARATDRAGKKVERYVTPPTIRKIHNLLRSMFNQAERWELVEKNPARFATVPKSEPQERAIWDSKTLFQAIDQCDDPRLKLAMNLAFSCSLRIGEVLGLTWDCIDISEDSIRAGKASVYIRKELQRVNKKSLETLGERDILYVFPEQTVNSKSVLVLKKPKTLSSVRKVFLPKTVAEMLVAWKMEQDATIRALGDEYQNYQLVICNQTGTPTEGNRLRHAMNSMIKNNNLPPVVFHSLRHSSITYKLKLNGGDIKAVQGDSGHAQASMVTDQYSHILDEGRQTNAQLLEEAFYAGKGSEKAPSVAPKADAVTLQAAAAGVDPNELIKILSNPAMVNLLKSLTQTLGTT